MMAAQVEFHTGVPDTVGFACRLIRKAYRHGATVLCLAPAERLDLLDRSLWTFVERDFIPHARLGAASSAQLGRTPIWLAATAPSGDVGRDVLLNVGAEWPQLPGHAVRAIEIVGVDADEVERGRGLWRRYKAAGFEVVHHPFGVARESGG